MIYSTPEEIASIPAYQLIFVWHTSAYIEFGEPKTFIDATIILTKKPKVHNEDVVFEGITVHVEGRSIKMRIAARGFLTSAHMKPQRTEYEQKEIYYIETVEDKRLWQFKRSTVTDIDKVVELMS